MNSQFVKDNKLTKMPEKEAIQNGLKEIKDDFNRNKVVSIHSRSDYETDYLYGDYGSFNMIFHTDDDKFGITITHVNSQTRGEYPIGFSEYQS